MAAPNPAQQISEEISSLQTRVNALQTGVQLTKSREEVETLQTNVTGIPAHILSLRMRGYVFEKDLEPQAQVLVAS